jgi:hypothetical protein
MYNPLDQARAALDALLGTTRDHAPTAPTADEAAAAHAASAAAAMSSSADGVELDLTARLSHLNGMCAAVVDGCGVMRALMSEATNHASAHSIALTLGNSPGAWPEVLRMRLTVVCRGVSLCRVSLCAAFGHNTPHAKSPNRHCLHVVTTVRTIGQSRIHPHIRPVSSLDQCNSLVRNGLTPTLGSAPRLLPLATAGITQMSPQAVDAELARLGCDVTGDYCVRRARLKRAARNRKAMMMLATEAPLGDDANDVDAKAMQKIQRELKEADAAPRYIAVVDFECTCEEDATDFPHEIIEFPMVRPAISPTALFPSYLYTACHQPHCLLPQLPLHGQPSAPLPCSPATFTRPARCPIVRCPSARSPACRQHRPWPCIYVRNPTQHRTAMTPHSRSRSSHVSPGGG